MLLKRGFLQISFAWLFSIIIGVVILSLTFYAAFKIIGTEQGVIGAKTGKEIGIILNPLETGIESARSSSFSLPVESRISLDCDEIGIFGNQKIEISQKSFGKWSKTDLEVLLKNRFLFGDQLEGKKFYIFSKQLEYPFKIADLSYILPEEKEYCFIGAPKNIVEEITGIGQKNLVVENCSENALKICFSNEVGCYAKVSYSTKTIEKPSGKMYFDDDSMMYAGIFSEKDYYECQIKRILKKVSALSDLYLRKIDVISIQGCDSNLVSELNGLKDKVAKLNSSANLGYSMATTITRIKETNKYNTNCKLW